MSYFYRKFLHKRKPRTMKNYLAQVLVVFLVMAGTVSAQDYTKILKRDLLSSKSSDGMTQKDLDELTIYDQTTNRRSGIKHVYAVQKHNGIEVFNANVAAAFRGEKLVYVGDNLQRDIANRMGEASSLVLTPVQAAVSAASLLGAGSANFTMLETKSSQEVLLDKGGVSLNNVPVKLMYVLTDDNTFKLAWDLNIHMIDQPHWYSVRVDAATGEILNQTDWASSCSSGFHSQSRVVSAPKVKEESFGFNREEISLAGAGTQYHVFPQPVESPIHGTTAIVVDPQDPEASPFGWHDIDGVEGAEFTITRGNNVWAQEDDNGNNGTSLFQTDGGEDLVFDFPFDFNSEPIVSIDAATTNLFYWNNVIHDVMYHYGFDEESGNFQETNYTGVGEGGDAVFADAQDGSQTSNADFLTPPDGLAPRMQMFLFFGSILTETLTIVGGSLDGTYVGVPAFFGPGIPDDEGGTPLTGSLVIVEDDGSGTPDTIDACDPILNAAELAGNIAVIRRGGNCQFGFKTVQAQNAGAIGVIMVNDGTTPDPIAQGPGMFGNQVTIPNIMVGQEDGENIIAAIQGGETINVSIIDLPESLMVDSTVDNLIVTHEYGHGISTRLAGGPSTSQCLRVAETIDEGWSDYFGLILTMTEDDLPETPRGIGTYVSLEEADGPGIRPRPYTTDRSINEITFEDSNDEENFPIPHGMGSIWATMLWDMTWMLIDEYGFDADLYNGVGGNNIALQLVMDGLKLQPCNPGFVDARDAVIAAVGINTMIPDEDKESISCALWGVFASRGLGFSASQGMVSITFDQVEAFDTPDFDNPSSCVVIPLSTDDFVANSFSISPNPSNGQISLTMTAGLGEGQVQIIDLNGRVVFTQDSLLDGNVNVDASGLSNGVYLVKVSNGKVSETEKLIIR